jgi:ATP-dependent RNA helicase RhlB
MEFRELNLHPDLQRGIDEAGFTTCMPVQEMVFAHSLKGGDIYAQSQTGTGKTAAFLISILQRIVANPEMRTRKALILAPTRELAVQIEAECEKLGKHLDIKAGSFYGGVSYGPQYDMLRADVQIIVGTPGRVIDLLQQGKMLLKDVGFLVIDEADRMFDMGFIDDLRKLLRYLPKSEERQTFLFSATLGLRVKDLAWEYMRSPKEIAIEPEHVTVELVKQELYHVGSHEKLSLLLGILEREKPESCLIFCNQKFMVEELARRLKINGFDCEFIMGDLPQAKRLEVIERLKAGEIKLLVATDVAARGLDIEALAVVINYDVPEDAESYVHRIGRTARAGKAGKAITLACEKFVYGLYYIEKYLGDKIPVMPFDEKLLLEDRSAGLRFSRDRGGEGRSRDSRQGARGYGRSGGGSRVGVKGGATGGNRGGGRQGGRPERPSDSRRRDERSDGPRNPQAQRPSGQQGQKPPYEASQRDGQHRDERQQAPRQQAPRQQAPRQQAPRQQAPRQQAPRQQAPRQQAPRQPETSRSTQRPVQRPSPGQDARAARPAPPSPANKDAGQAKTPGIVERIKRLFRRGGDPSSSKRR